MHDSLPQRFDRDIFRITRRGVLKSIAVCGPALACGGAAGIALHAAQSDGEKNPVEARYYDKLDNKKIQCRLCPKECAIDNMERGFCGVRENIDGKYYTYVYARPCSINKDPIEKKPLFHFLPGTEALSLATVGCNMDCKFCQNWQISQMRPEQSESRHVTPQEMAKLAVDNGCPAIAYTYTEPVVFYEYVFDCALAGHERNVRSVMISNGYIRQEPMKALVKNLDAVKIDLKAFTEKFYKDVCVGELKPVLETLVLLRTLNIWTEIVYLMVPTLNDSARELKEMCAWIVRELGPDVPLHFSRFHPMYKLTNLPPTPLLTLENARKIALDAGIHFVYIGNVPMHEAESTYCPGCGKRIIHRIGYTIAEHRVSEGACSFCKKPIPGVWS